MIGVRGGSSAAIGRDWLRGLFFGIDLAFEFVRPAAAFQVDKAIVSFFVATEAEHPARRWPLIRFAHTCSDSPQVSKRRPTRMLQGNLLWSVSADKRSVAESRSKESLLAIVKFGKQ